MQTLIKFPALLSIENDDLLYFLPSAEGLSNELENHFLTHADTCKVFDHTGKQFILSLAKQGASSSSYTLYPSTQLELVDFNQMVRNHLSARQQCCVLKIEINSFEQGFQLVFDTIED